MNASIDPFAGMPSTERTMNLTSRTFNPNSTAYSKDGNETTQNTAAF